MKILALDFDGVLNTSPFAVSGVHFNKAACQNINSLLAKEPDLRIVVSSSWRHFGLKSVKETLRLAGIDPIKVIDITDEDFGGDRDQKILRWVHAHPEVTHYVAFDDEASDMGRIKDHFVKINPYVGVTSKDIEKALKILND